MASLLFGEMQFSFLLCKGIIDPNGGMMTRFAFIVCPLSILVFTSICIFQWQYFGPYSYQIPEEMKNQLFQSLSSHCATFFFAVFCRSIFSLIASRCSDSACAVVSLTISLITGASNLLVSLGLSPVSVIVQSGEILIHFQWAARMVCVPLMVFVVAEFVRAKYLILGMAVQFLAVTFGYIAEVTSIRYTKILCSGLALVLYIFILVCIILVCTTLSTYCKVMKTKESKHKFELSQGSIRVLGFCIIIIWTVIAGAFLLSHFGIISQRTYFLMSPLLGVCSQGFFVGLLLEMNCSSNKLKMRQMVGDLQKQNNFQSKFLRFVYHEIRNPFNTIMLGLDLMLSELQSKEHLKVMTMLKKSAQSLHRVINDAVELSKNQGKLVLIKEPTKIDDLVEEVLAEFQNLADSKDVTFTTQIARNAPEVFADKTKLKKMFQTLVSNAVNYSFPGKPITVIFEVEDFLPLGMVSCNFSVIDYGPGISNDVLPLLFEPFGLVRPGDFSEDEDRGSGLGLCIAQQLANSMEAKITVNTDLEKGSYFNIFFTVEACPAHKNHSVSLLHPSFSESFSVKEKSHRLVVSSKKKHLPQKVLAVKEKAGIKNKSTVQFHEQKPDMENSDPMHSSSSKDSSLSISRSMRKQRDTKGKINWNLIFRTSDATENTIHGKYTLTAARSINHTTFSGFQSGVAPFQKTKVPILAALTEIGGSSPSPPSSINEKSSWHKLKMSASSSQIHSEQRSKHSFRSTCSRANSKSIHSACSSDRGELEFKEISQQELKVADEQNQLHSQCPWLERSSRRLSILHSERNQETLECPMFSATAGVPPGLSPKTAKNGHMSSLVHPFHSVKLTTPSGLLKASRFFQEDFDCRTGSRENSGKAPTGCSPEIFPAPHGRLDPLPMRLAHDPQQPTEARSMQAKKTILIVDDVHSNAKLAEMILKKAGFSCEVAYNGLEAVNAVRSKHFHLILMDNVMPVMNGVQATREILSFNPEAVIVGMTGNILQSDQDEFLKAGAKVILLKPVERIQLLQTCNQFCSYSN